MLLPHTKKKKSQNSFFIPNIMQGVQNDFFPHSGSAFTQNFLATFPQKSIPSQGVQHYFKFIGLL